MRRPVITLLDCLAVLLVLLTIQTNQTCASDTIPPLTTASVLMGTYKDAQNIVLTCTDGSGSGCASTYYCLGSGCSPATVYVDPITIAESTALRFYSVDLTGNYEPAKTYAYTIDPTLTYQAERYWPQLEQPWYFKNPSGVAVAPGGIVYVADTNNHQIQKFDSNGVFLAQWGSYGSGNAQFNSPKGVVADSNGNLYVADLNNHRIQKFDSEGNYLTQWGTLGSGAGQFNYVQNVAIDAAGNIYAADFYNSRIQKFDASGAFVTQWSISYPSSVAVDSSGNVYVAETTYHRIQKFDENGASLGLFGSFGSGNGQFSNPSGVAVDAGGNFYVSDSNNDRIQKFSSSGNYLTQWGTNGNGSSQFNGPRGLALDSNGFLYVTDSGNNRIQKFATSGAYASQWGASGNSIGQLTAPNNAAVDADGNVYVSDGGNNRIQKFDNNGNYQTQWGAFGSGLAQFKTPQGLAMDLAGNLFVADSGNNRIQKFDSNGTYLTQWGSSGEADGQFYTPITVAADPAGNVYAGDNLTNRMQKFGSNGSFQAKWGAYGSGSGQFSYPKGVAAGSGTVYVTDTGNKRIQKFNSSGVFQTAWGSAGSGDGQFNNPRSLAVDASGNVYVADTNNNRIQKFDNNGTYLAQIGTPGSGNGQLLSPTGVAVDGSGNLFVVDANNRIQKFNPPPTVPGVPTAVVAIPGNGQATVSFSTPTNNGGKPVLFYTATSTPGDISVSGSSPITVAGLINGTPYTFVVTATNATGTGPASGASNSVIPSETVTGVCGSANGGNFTVAPSSSLCAAGVASDVTGSGPWNWTCQGTVGGADASCSANLQSYAMYVTKTGAGNLNGIVTTNTGTLSWNGISGSASYSGGATANLTAIAGTGSIFTGWNSCDSVNANVCTVTMNSVRSVAADFAQVSACIANSECGTGHFCSKASGSCGGIGTCTTWNPGAICITVWTPVCGCNGLTYGNSCEAARAGVSVAYSGECSLNSCNASYLAAPHGSSICWGMNLPSEVLYINLPKTVIIGGGVTLSGINISDGSLEIQGATIQ